MIDTSMRNNVAGANETVNRTSIPSTMELLPARIHGGGKDVHITNMINFGLYRRSMMDCRLHKEIVNKENESRSILGYPVAMSRRSEASIHLYRSAE
jgi:hypothetical protein